MNAFGRGITVVLLSTLGITSVAITARAETASPHATTVAKRVTDPTGDDGSGYEPAGDLVRVDVSRRATSIVVSALASSAEDPDVDLNWLSPGAEGLRTSLTWALDVNGDGLTDYDLAYGNGRGDLAPESNLDDVLCRPQTSWDARGYRAVFTPACIDDPAQLRVAAYLVYVTPDTVSRDKTDYTATATRPTPPSALGRHVTFNCTIRAKANGKFATTEIADKGTAKDRLRARADTVGTSRKYQCIAVGTNEWAIRARANRAFVTALGGAGKGTLRAGAPKVGPRGMFTFQPVEKCSCFAIQAANHRFVTAHVELPGARYGTLRADAPRIAKNQEFEIRG